MRNTTTLAGLAREYGIPKTSFWRLFKRSQCKTLSGFIEQLPSLLEGGRSGKQDSLAKARQQALQMRKGEKTISFSWLSKKWGVAKTTLYRQFKKSTCKTVEEFSLLLAKQYLSKEAQRLTRKVLQDSYDVYK